MAGINMYGIYSKSDSERIQHYPSNVEEMLEVKRKRKPKRNFDFLLGADKINAKDYPWEF